MVVPSLVLQVLLAFPAQQVVLTPLHPRVRFVPPEPRLGDAVVVYVEEHDQEIRFGRVRMLGYEISLLRASETELRAVAPIQTDLIPDEYPVTIEVRGSEIEARLTIASREFDTDELTVRSQFVLPESPDLRARMRAEASEMRALWDPAPTPLSFHGGFRRPVPGAVTAVFGTHRIFNGVRRSVHYGLDLDGRVGTPIRAIQAGRVVMSAMRFTTGGTVVLDHGGGLFSLYFHMSRRQVLGGAWVRAGDFIGGVGKTGRVTGPHLHLAVVLRTVELDSTPAALLLDDRMVDDPRMDDDPRMVDRVRVFHVDPESLLRLVLEGDARFLGPTMKTSTD